MNILSTQKILTLIGYALWYKFFVRLKWIKPILLCNSGCGTRVSDPIIR